VAPHTILWTKKWPKNWGLPVTPISEFWVTVANGERLSCGEKHEGVCLLIQGMKIIVTLFSLPLNGLDIVLGIQWLEKLGPIVCDWGKLSITITRGSQVFKIISQPRGHGKVVTNALLIREVQSGGEIFAVMVRQAQPAGRPEIVEEIQRIPSRIFSHSGRAQVPATNPGV
jgi:hypothetical protein